MTVCQFCGSDHQTTAAAIRAAVWRVCGAHASSVTIDAAGLHTRVSIQPESVHYSESWRRVDGGYEHRSTSWLHAHVDTGYLVSLTEQALFVAVAFGARVQA